MRKSKLILTVFIVVSLIIIAAAFVSAQSDSFAFVSSDCVWRCFDLGDGTASLCAGISNMPSYQGEEKVVYIPKSIDSYPIAEIGTYAFCGCETVEKIIVPEGVKSIKRYAFVTVPNLKSVVLPKSIEVIEDGGLYTEEPVEYIVVKDSFVYNYLKDSDLTLRVIDSEFSSDYKGWETVDGDKYYYLNGSPVKKKLITVDGKKYYFGSDGKMYKKRLISVNSKKYYLGSDGAAYTSRLISLSGKKYYLGSDGIAYKSRLASINGKKYYFGSDGVAYKSRLISVKNKKYYIGSDCTAYKSKFASLSGKKYYFGSDCIMRTGWRNIKDENGVSHKYYFGTDGVMRKGWQKIKLLSGKTYKYYFKTNGIMVTGKVSINSKTEYFQSNGRYVEPGSALLKKVYITPTGKKYHLNKNCAGSTAKQVTLLEAKEKGLTPCSKCA